MTTSDISHDRPLSTSAPVLPASTAPTTPTAAEAAPRTGATSTARRRPAGPWWLRHGVRPLLLAADGLALGAALLVEGARTSTLVFAGLFLALLAAGGLYRSRLSLSILDDTPRISGRWLAALALTVLAQASLNRVRWGDEIVDWRVVGAAAIALGWMIALRAAAYAFVRVLRRRKRVAHRTLVLGAGQVGTQVVQTLQAHPEYGLEPVGFLDNDPLMALTDPALPVLGDTAHLADVLRRDDIHNVVVAFTSQRESTMVDLIRTCDRLQCEIFLVPRLFEVHHVSEDMDTVWGLPLVRLRRRTYRSRGWHVKRMVDIAFAAGALLVLSPLLLLVALLVRLEGGPGILFRQLRVGADGREFELLKFRSLRPADETESATRWNVANDHRMGPVGKFLRTTSIDELPQLLNILRGEMSLVGPRPERPHFVEQFTRDYPHYVARHRVPSGLTGWAQVHGLRGDTSIADRARFDNYYIENWSLWLDAKILLRTVGSVVRGQGG